MSPAVRRYAVSDHDREKVVRSHSPRVAAVVAVRDLGLRAGPLAVAPAWEHSSGDVKYFFVRSVGRGQYSSVPTTATTFLNRDAQGELL